jgi:glycerophosphoryl diester phosphodiesterase
LRSYNPVFYTLDWLTERPIAHRGLHGDGRVENSLAAARAAVEANYAIECDVLLSKDGEVFVFHDDTLERLTNETGRFSDREAAALKQISLKGSSEKIPTLKEFLGAVGGKVPLVIELKSDWDGSEALAVKVADMLVDYAGPVAVMSFDPALVETLRKHAPGLPRGIVAEWKYKPSDWPGLPWLERFKLAYLLHIFSTKPHFVSYSAGDLPALAPLLARHVMGMKLICWTIRSPEQQRRALWWSEQITFENFRP